MIWFRKLKEWSGVAVLDLPRYLASIDGGSLKWLEICNRIETLSNNPNGAGIYCNWKWSSNLHAPQLMPFLGRRLMKRAFQKFPIQFSDILEAESKSPRVSFIIGHRGIERLPHLLLTLKSIAAQTQAPFECIVVEQSAHPEIETFLPRWVRYYHDKSEIPSYNRSKTFNVGCRYAKGDVLVLHDNDMPVPQCYASEVLKIFDTGYEVINLKRFIFYLGEKTTNHFFQGSYFKSPLHFDAIVQNLEAGGSLAISKQAYYGVGGFDESFVGWGGEDIEFWERAITRKTWNYHYLPILHLHHAPQPEKNKNKDTSAMSRYVEMSLILPKDRIQELKNKFQT